MFPVVWLVRQTRVEVDAFTERALSWSVCWVCDLSEQCRVRVGIVVSMSFNSISRQRVLAFFILTLFIPCSAGGILDMRLICLS